MRDNRKYQRPSTAILDLDNTLYEYLPCHSLGLAEAGNCFEVETGIGFEMFQSSLNRSRVNLKTTLSNQASSHNRLLYFKGVLEMMGLSNRLDLAMQLENAYWAGYFSRMYLEDGVLNFLELCRQSGISIVIATDFECRLQIKKLCILGLEDMIDTLVTSEEMGVDKPRWELAPKLNNSGLDLTHVWVIGDDEDKDGGLAGQFSSAAFLHTSPKSVGGNGRKTVAFEDVAKLLGKVLDAKHSS